MLIANDRSIYTTQHHYTKRNKQDVCYGMTTSSQMKVQALSQLKKLLISETVHSQEIKLKTSKAEVNNERFSYLTTIKLKRFSRVIKEVIDDAKYLKAKQVYRLCVV